MTLSEKPTNKILLKAYTNSEWDTCNIAVFSIDNAYLEVLKRRRNIIQHLDNTDDAVFAIESLMQPCEFNYDSSYELLELLGKKNWSYVNITDEELGKLLKPDNRLDETRSKVYVDGTVAFKATGKHTDEEFWTDSINLNDL